MKTTKMTLRALPLLLLVALLFSACTPAPTGWEDATYTQDTEVGEGATTVTVKVTADEKSVTITLNTDKVFLADALLAEGLCAGEEDSFGLYIKYVNGIRADFDLDGGYWWKLLVDGEAAQVGASETPVVSGTVYEFVRTK